MNEATLDKRIDRNDAIRRICDHGIDLNKLSPEQKADLTRAYLDCVSGTGFMGKYIYGVNVRTPDNLSIIEPYFASSGMLYEKPENNKSLPEFTDRFGIREIFFYADLNEASLARNIIIHTLIFDAAADNHPDQVEIQRWLQDEKSFFHVHIKNLGVKSSRVYMWISSEDYFTSSPEDMRDYWEDKDNPLTKRNGQALSNIMAVSDDRDFLQDHILSRRIDLLDFLFLLKARHLYEQNLQRLRASEKSAKAAIMSRNMSHNLGSHVMAYLKQHLYSVKDMIKDNILDQFLSPDDTIEAIQKDVHAWLQKVNDKIASNDDTIKEIAMPFLVGLGKFISYLQERQDFIATISTDYHPYFSSVNFKDFIYDELNSDLRYERHKDRSGMRPDNILLGNLAKSEGLARVTRPTESKKSSMSNIVLKFRDFDGKPVFDPQGTSILSGRRKAARSLDQMRDLEISLPGGVVGRQAFFSIVENLIRNAAKHGKWGEDAGTSKRDLVLTFDFYRDADDFSRAPHNDTFVRYERGKTSVCRPVSGELDTKRFLRKYYSDASDFPDLSVFTVTDNMWFELVPTRETFLKYKDNEDVLAKLFELAEGSHLTAMRGALRQRYIDKDGRMINENKGIKEMRISAAWMRSLSDSLRYNPFVREEDANNEQWKGKAPILLARAVAERGEDKKKSVIKTSIKVKDVQYEIEAIPYNLQMVFCVMKPKKIAIVSDKRPFQADFKQQLRQVSWAAFSSAEYRNSRHVNRSYEFIIIDDIPKGKSKTTDSVYFQKIRCISHSRTFRLSSLPKDLQQPINQIISSAKFDTQVLDSIESEMYKALAGFPVTDSIRISDNKTYNKYQREPGLKHSKMITIAHGKSTDDNGSMCKFIYRKHHEMDKEFSTFMNEKPVIDIFAKDDDQKEKIVTFVEGITGNNSTDRLVRNDLLNDKWAFAHLHAMKQKIAIFDERIFSRVYRVDEMDIKNHNQTPEPFTPIPEGSDMEVCHILEELRGILPKNITNNTTNNAVLYQDVNSFLEERHLKKQELIQADRIGLANAMKGVFVFTVIKIHGGLDIYGFLSQDYDIDKYYSFVGKIGSISLDSKDHIRVDFTERGALYEGKFNSISIHQGLLDKVYETLGIHDKNKKEEVTCRLYEKFSSKKGDDIQDFYDENDQVNGRFLPHLMIHSGRSKPSDWDMPQHQPFIQYAAIEHAVWDCKYSLVELMDFARFEQYED